MSNPDEEIFINPELLDRLYKSYGFESENKEDDVKVFLYRKSRYIGVDIIPMNNTESSFQLAERKKQQYSELGYAVNLKYIKNNEDAEIELFRSFFSYIPTKERLKRKYQDFEKRQAKQLLGYKYEYIESPYEIFPTIPSDSIFATILDKLFSNYPELIILEAAAGYGKTCTAYEILKNLIPVDNDKLPIFTELSRNRGAKIFRYILLDEIDLEFPSLDSPLVIKEIKNGRIPLIIDGFDELLEKVHNENNIDNSFEEVESMLDTIGNLLEYKSKILLTTRKTAIFTGVEFDKWLQKWDNKFIVTRISLKEPRIKDWLGDERNIKIKKFNTPIQSLANPVLLTFLRHSDDKNFDELILNPNRLVDHYFVRLLEREKERQMLYMTVANQLLLFKNVAKSLLSLDSTSEEKEFFKLIIIENNKKLLEDTLLLYSGINKPTIDNLVDTLSTHALLDRKGRDQDQIGFINEFVFGSFIGQIIINEEQKLSNLKYSVFMIELAVTAFRVQEPNNRFSFWEKVQDILDKLQDLSIFTFDIYLLNALVRNYSDLSVADFNFYDTQFTNFNIVSSVFLNCRFKNCIFDILFLSGISFINCKFEECTVLNGPFLDNQHEIVTITCKQVNCQILVEEQSIYVEHELSLVNDLQKQILTQLWKISPHKGHNLLILVGFFKKNQRKAIYTSLKILQEQKYLSIQGHYVYFNINKITLIQAIIESPS